MYSKIIHFLQTPTIIDISLYLSIPVGKIAQKAACKTIWHCI